MIPSFLKPYHTNLSNLIRIGRESDGGYVIDKRVIYKTKTIITCGLEAEWSFEKEFQKFNNNCKIIAFDHTVTNKFWIKRFFKDFLYLLLLRKIKINQILDVFKFFEYLIFFGNKNKHYLKKIDPKRKDKDKYISITEAIGNNKVKIVYFIEREKHKKIIYPIAALNDKKETLEVYDFFLDNKSLPKTLKWGFETVK